MIHLEAWSISDIRNEQQLRGNSEILGNSVQASVEDEDATRRGGEISSEVEFEEGREAKISEVRVIV